MHNNNITKPMAQIVSVNQYGEAICAGAAKISTTQGNAMEIFNTTKESENNISLIKKVLRSGHCSVLEHAVFSIALWNVSVFVEQFFIEARLASFTVKSRRYVDFGGQGYYIPPELSKESREVYCQYMDSLFDAYRKLLELGAPKEDARFLLPYSFHSSFYCTLNARQLVHVINAARARGNAELTGIADQLAEQLEELFPGAAPLLSHGAPVEPHSKWFYRHDFIGEDDAGVVYILQKPYLPERILRDTWGIARPGEKYNLELLTASERPRELEHLNYTFAIEDISLPALTHLVRHRMQSIVVSPLERIDGVRQLLPNNIVNNPVWRDVYEDALSKASENRGALNQNAELREHSVYFLPSATLTTVITTMNARELQLFIRLRICNRAQWEIRNIALRMLKAVTPTYPELFQYYGPACHTTGKCPEGALSCGKGFNPDN